LEDVARRQTGSKQPRPGDIVLVKGSHGMRMTASTRWRAAHDPVIHGSCLGWYRLHADRDLRAAAGVLRYLKVGKAIRADGPERHFAKLGTPTMGGIMIVIPVLLITLLMNASSIFGLALLGRSVILPMGTMIVYTLLGAVDDWAGLRGERRAKGLSARTKFIFQLIFAVGIAFALKYVLDAPDLFIPGIPGTLSLGIWYIPIATLGLYIFECDQSHRWPGWAGRFDFRDCFCDLRRDCADPGAILPCSLLLHGRGCDLRIPVVQRPSSIALHGRHRLALSGCHAECGRPHVRAVGAAPNYCHHPHQRRMSVILQVGYFKLTGGKRLFKMAPLQHHFELLGWSETQVVQRFWLITLLFAMVGVALALV
jgi:phospho-N-acetylmuramoyl-pentapeptide-transferase